MPFDLTPRELEITRLVSLGCTTEDIAAILDVAPSTVDTHKTNAMDKMGVKKAVLMTRIALKSRITKIGEKLTPAEKRKRGRRKDGWN